jgi:uncharacterized protein with HEPN domain
MIEAADAIVEFVAGLDEDDFYSDSLRQSAVLQKLIVIGEAATRLPQEFRDRHPQLEWGQIVAFRNVLVHAYFSIKLPIVWETINHDVPALRRQVAQILEQEYE